MKKLSIIMALLLCLTIGGVYATWSYAGTNDIADAFAEAKATIADAELVGANGTYKVESNLVLTVDQANDEHEAELVFSSNDGKPIHLTVTFTPSINAPENIKEKAVPSELYFGTSTTMQYPIDEDGNFKEDGEKTDIFKFGDNNKYASDGKFEENITWSGPDSNGVFTYTLNGDNLKSMIQLSQAFKLDLKSEHDKFRECLSGNITARVTDGTVTGTTANT